MKVVVATLLICSCFASWFATPDPSDIQSFIQGLNTGLRKGGADDCTAAVDSLNATGLLILADLEKLAGGDTSVAAQLETDVKTLVAAAPAAEKTCDTDALMAQMFQLFNPTTGYDLMISRYNANKSAIDAAAKVVVTCNANPSSCNWEACGTAWGQIVRLMTTWGI